MQTLSYIMGYTVVYSLYGFIPPTYVRDPPGYTTSPQVSCVHKNGIKRYKNGINGITFFYRSRRRHIKFCVSGITLRRLLLIMLFLCRAMYQNVALGLAYTSVHIPW